MPLTAESESEFTCYYSIKFPGDPDRLSPGNGKMQMAGDPRGDEERGTRGESPLCGPNVTSTVRISTAFIEAIIHLKKLCIYIK